MLERVTHSPFPRLIIELSQRQRFSFLWWYKRFHHELHGLALGTKWCWWLFAFYLGAAVSHDRFWLYEDFKKCFNDSIDVGVRTFGLCHSFYLGVASLRESWII